ncbi:MAG: ABC transporter permease [Actinobacteria bacterium]|nr:ABC transporter permease [Actinomycetota bacterium]MCB9388186.1 ABC transporter permease [Acidimicrobiia bacterium]
MFVASRDMRRQAGRFVLLTGAIALLVLLLGFFQTVSSALTSGITGGLLNNQADLLVYSDKARLNPAASVLAPDAASRVSDVDGVERAAGVGRGQFADQSADGDVTVIGLDDLAFGGPAKVATGRRATKPGEALASSPDLSSSDVSYAVGDTLTLEGVDLVVVGTSDGAAFDVGPTMYVSFEDLQTMKSNDAGVQVPALFSWVAVELADGVDSDTVVAQIDDLGVPASSDTTTAAPASASLASTGFEAVDRSAAADALPGVDQITQSFNILYLLLFIVVTIVTGVFFLILTVQKRDSLVLMRALGASRADVIKPILIEVVLVVLVGSVLGTAVAAGLLEIAKDSFGTLDPITAALSVVLILLLGIVSSFASVRRVLQVDPVEAARRRGAS